MKVITIKQPWATLIAYGYKEYEFRSWKIKYRGKLLIHAGKGIDKKAMDRVKHLNLEYPSSRIIASVNLNDCISVNEEMIKQLINKNKEIYGFGNYENNYAWKLSNIEKIDNHKYVKGKLGLWNIEL
jgi:hypothetical protein